MIKQNRHYFIPDTHDAVIWRYFKQAKLKSLLEEQALYFSRSDLLGDDHEGSVTTATIKNRPLFYKDAPKSFLEKGAAENARAVAKCVYVSCWHLSPHESVAMWRQYTEEGKGVAIRSRVSLLKEGILDEENEFLLGEVKYVDYETYPISEWSVFEPFFHKQNIHQHESEFRIIKHNLENLGAIASETTIPERGLFIPIDLKTIIEAIVISPYADQKFNDDVGALVSNSGFKNLLTPSSIRRQPTF